MSKSTYYIPTCVPGKYRILEFEHNCDDDTTAATNAALLAASCRHRPKPETFPEIQMLRRVIKIATNPLPAILKRCCNPHTTTAEPQPDQPEPMILVDGWPVRAEQPARL